MNKKIFFQLTLIALIIFLLSFFMFYYYNINKMNSSNNLSVIDNLDKKIEISNENIIKDIRYFSKDAQNNSYEIISDFGKINLDNPDITFMTNVTASIYLENSNNIIITSKFANFNNSNYETEFYENVNIVRGDERIKSQKLEFSLIKDLILISDQVILEKPSFNLKADKVKIDLITKNSTIYMDDSTKKVIAVGENK
jgi:LPS export ABC transporter protein LptC